MIYIIYIIYIKIIYMIIVGKKVECGLNEHIKTFNKMVKTMIKESNRNSRNIKTLYQK